MDKFETPEKTKEETVWEVIETENTKRITDILFIDSI